ncbi:MAG TPA: hypothetical protein VH682_18610, partial [Gemmataceae bacterium]
MGWLRVLWVVTDAAGVRCRLLYRLTRAMTVPPGSATDAIVVSDHRSSPDHQIPVDRHGQVVPWIGSAPARRRP